VSDLTAFLQARLDEVEVRAREHHARYCGTPVELGDCDCALPIGYVIADLAAKRQIVTEDADDGGDGLYLDGVWSEHQRVLCLLAQPFSIHVDFDPGWKL
jgi:hypothetical protein